MGRAVIGIDPALLKTGIAVIEDGKRIMYYKQIKINPKQSMGARLSSFKEELQNLPQADTVALETPFLGKNAQTFLKLGYIRGLILTWAHERNMKLYEYTPQQIKHSITSWRLAPKEQVARVLNVLFPKLPKDLPDDITDAIAIALTCTWRNL